MSKYNLDKMTMTEKVDAAFKESMKKGHQKSKRDQHPHRHLGRGSSK